MENKQFGAALALGAFLCLGLALLGTQIYRGVTAVKSLERAVSVKGLSEREVPADVAIWPIKFSDVGNDLSALFASVGEKNALVTVFLKENGFRDEEISISVPAVNDRQAQGYADAARMPFRYAANSTITVYSLKVDQVRTAMSRIMELGKRGLALVGEDYGVRPEFIFTKLNDLKPPMIEEATRNAREVAEKFAKDSNSRLGKIRTANQGLFSISDRDSNTPHIKKVRVVSTVEYYLSD